ncbi:HPr kinase [Novosphingobium sediminis]|uniref:HPr kinase n=1 Tax=Novosphingobium sediminis TaxID=707214 RepID=A0A512AMJ3_9SPHN|nr:HPr kinase/phosphatase C-terminal domain-containing protein [Novosphingobium sediminis]GEO00904.1 HPr kinase [Novosphingobium sediminis]
MNHQATCVAIAGRAVLIEGAPGAGKSSLALALIDRGAMLVGDDGVALERRGAHLLASPVPATAGLLEVRGLGFVTMPVLAGVPVALVIVLTPDAPRFIEEPEQVTRHGAVLPLIRIWPESPVIHLRAELALRQYGLAV